MQTLERNKRGQFFSGSTPWNKGEKLSASHCKNLSEAHKGIKQCKESIEKRVKKITGSKHPLWKGDGVGYDALHMWLRRHYGDAHKCEIAGCKYPRMNARKVWMKKPKRYEWANKSGKYQRARRDWFMACPSCHRTYDHAK